MKIGRRELCQTRIQRDQGSLNLQQQTSVGNPPCLLHALPLFHAQEERKVLHDRIVKFNLINVKYTFRFIFHVSSDFPCSLHMAAWRDSISSPAVIRCRIKSLYRKEQLSRFEGATKPFCRAPSLTKEDTPTFFLYNRRKDHSTMLLSPNHFLCVKGSTEE